MSVRSLEFGPMEICLVFFFFFLHLQLEYLSELKNIYFTVLPSSHELICHINFARFRSILTLTRYPGTQFSNTVKSYK